MERDTAGMFGSFAMTRLVTCALLAGALAGCRKPVANAAELTVGTPAPAPRQEWQDVADLPDCAPERCTGPGMGMPNWTCPDGRRGGPVCKEGPNGRCNWTVVRCPQADPGVTPAPRPTVAVTRTPPPTPKPTPLPRATGRVMGSVEEAAADACAKTCAGGKTRRGIVRCVDDDRRILGVVAAINCPAVSAPRDHERRPLTCAGFVAESACAESAQCLKMDGTCCADDGGRLVVPTGSLGNMYCGSPGQRCSRCKCLPGEALIATPSGDRPIRDLEIGDEIWTETSDGPRVADAIVEVARVPAPPGHRILELVLEDGRVVRGSPTHPAADGAGAPLETFTVGTRLDGSRVIGSRLLPEPVRTTHDVLPAGETGVYWVDGVRLRSTIPVGSRVLTGRR